jgi:hypothetical protein
VEIFPGRTVFFAASCKKNPGCQTISNLDKEKAWEAIVVFEKWLPGMNR